MEIVIAGQLTEQVEPVAVGQSEIDKGDVELDGAQQFLGRRAAVCDIHGIGLVAQACGDDMGEVGIILDEQDAHGAVSQSS
jgi:hypothetical protein